MATKRKSVKSKFISEDMNELLNTSQFLKDFPINKKTQKHIQKETFEEDNIFKSEPICKKKKNESHFEATQKVLNIMDQQLTKRKKNSDNLFNSLSDIMSALKADDVVMTENEQKLEQLIGALMKCLQQSTLARKQKLKTLEEIHSSYKIKVEGLLTRGAIKPDDRPLWFDVYRAFPPITEPKFAKPKPEIKPIRQILYKEDSIRVKFHSSGFGLGAVNLLNQNTDTQTKLLLEQYEKLKSEHVPENELIEKSAEIVAVERQSELQKPPKVIAKNPDSVTAQVLAEADLKNIFKE